MSANRRRTPTPAERVVVFVCTGSGGEVHRRRKLAEVTLRAGVAVEVGGKNGLRRAIAENAARREVPDVTISDFDFYCKQCGRSHQRRQVAMAAKVAELLTRHADHSRVVHDLRLD